MNNPIDNNACTALLQNHNRGKVNQEMNEAFANLVRDVRKHGKGGELILKICVKPAQGGDARQVTIAANITTKAPMGAPYASIYFTTEDGAVQKNDPDQEEFHFRPIPGGAPAPAEASTTNTNAQTA